MRVAAGNVVRLPIPSYYFHFSCVFFIKEGMDRPCVPISFFIQLLQRIPLLC